jgi:hypothetical protein
VKTLAGQGLKSKGIVGAWLACLSVGLALPGCAIGGPTLAPRTQFTLGAVEEGAPAAAMTETVRLQGWATVPASMTGLANVQNGKVSGSPVVVTSATTGHVLAKGVTYYDGSFLVDVPVAGPQLAAVVAIDLVDKADQTKTATLQAPVMLYPGVNQAEVDLGPGSTALVQFLSQVATASTPDVAAQPRLSDLIANFATADQRQFAQLAEASPEIQKVSSLLAFQSGIQAYVGRLTGGMRGGRKAANGASQVGANRL